MVLVFGWSREGVKEGLVFEIFSFGFVFVGWLGKWKQVWFIISVGR